MGEYLELIEQTITDMNWATNPNDFEIYADSFVVDKEQREPLCTVLFINIFYKKKLILKEEIRTLVYSNELADLLYKKVILVIMMHGLSQLATTSEMIQKEIESLKT